MSLQLLAREPGTAYEVGVDAGRKVHLYRIYQTRSYEGALFGRPTARPTGASSSARLLFAVSVSGSGANRR